jgi:hypothetical protein
MAPSPVANGQFGGPAGRASLPGSEPAPSGAPSESPRRGPQELVKAPRQVSLVGVPELGRDVGERLAPEDPVASRFHPATLAVGMGCDAECRAEGPRQVGRAGAHLVGHIAHPRVAEQVGVEIGPYRLGRSVTDGRRGSRGRLPEVGLDRLEQKVQPDLGLERAARAAKCLVDLPDLVGSAWGAKDRPIDTWPYERIRQGAGCQVEHPHPVPACDRGPAVVDHVRGQHGCGRHWGEAWAPVEVIRYAAALHDEQGPRIVGVRRVGVVHEGRLERLSDAVNGGVPCV